MLWHEIIEKYPGNGSSAVLILMFLTFGHDYPYNIARTLKPHENILKKRGLGRLSHGNLVSATMNQMEKDRLIILETVNSFNPRNYYSLNPEVIRAPMMPQFFDIKMEKPIHIEPFYLMRRSIFDRNSIDLFLAHTHTLLELYSLNIPFLFDMSNYDKYINSCTSIPIELLKDDHNRDEQKKNFIARYLTINEPTVNRKQLIAKIIGKYIYESKLDFISFLIFLEKLYFEINNMKYKIDWFLHNTYYNEWEPNDFLELEILDPRLFAAKCNYIELKNKIEKINETIPMNIRQDIAPFQVSLLHYIAELVKFERIKEEENPNRFISHLRRDGRSRFRVKRK